MASNDIAELLVKIDSGQIDHSVRSLDSFVRRAELAEDETMQLGRVTDAVFEQLEKDLTVIENKGHVFENFSTTIPEIQAVEAALNRLLQHGVSPNADAVQKLRAQYDKLNEEAKQVAGSTGRMNKGMGQTAGLLQNVGFLIQDAPFAIMSGNLAAVANNIPMVTDGFQRLSMTAGGSVGALKMLGSTLMGPTGLIMLFATVLPAALVTAQSGVLDFGDEATDTEDKVDRLSQSIDRFVESVSDINNQNVFDPLGAVSGRQELGELQDLQSRLSVLTELRREAEYTRELVRGIAQGGIGSAGQVDMIQGYQNKLEGLNGAIRQQEALFGALSDAEADAIQKKIDDRIATQKLNDAFLKLNPALGFQVTLNEQLSPALRDIELGLSGSESQLQSLISSYDAQIENLRSHNNLTEQERDILYSLVQARDRATQALNDERNAVDDAGEVVEDLIASIEGVAFAGGELDRQFTIIERKAQVFDDFDAKGAKVQVLEDRIISLIERGVDPASDSIQRLIDQMNKLEDPFNAQSTQLQKVEQEYKDIAEAAGYTYDETSKIAEAADDLGLSFESAFENAIIQGENLSGVLNGILQDMSRIILQSQVTKPLGDAFSGFVGDAFGGGSSQSVNDALITKDGDVINMNPKDNLYAFQGDPGEKAGGGNVTVNVINNNGSEVKTQQRKTAGGGMEIDVLIDNKIREGLNNGRYDREMQSNFNLNRSGY